MRHRISGVSAGKEWLGSKHLPRQSLQFIAGETNRSGETPPGLAGQQALQRSLLLEAVQRPVGNPAPALQVLALHLRHTLSLGSPCTPFLHCSISSGVCS